MASAGKGVGGGAKCTKPVHSKRVHLVAGEKNSSGSSVRILFCMPSIFLQNS